MQHMQKYAMRVGTQYNHMRSFSTIVNKQLSMEHNRHNIHSKLTTDDSGSAYYIGLIHTYPAWSTIFRSLLRYMTFSRFHSDSAQNPYGHTLCEFFRFEEQKLVEDTVMNVGMNADFDRTDFIHFIPSHKYFFNSSSENSDVVGNNQNGLLERSFITLNIRVTRSEYVALKQYFEALKKESFEFRSMRFTLLSHMFLNTIRRLFPSLGMVERGNCCYWTSRGFASVGLVLTANSFPLVCFYKFLASALYRNNTNTLGYHITLYKAPHYDGMPKGTLLYPFFWINHGYAKFWKMEKIAHSVVELIQTDTKCDEYEVVVSNKTDIDKIKSRTEKIMTYLNNILYHK